MARRAQLRPHDAAGAEGAPDLRQRGALEHASRNGEQLECGGDIRDRLGADRIIGEDAGGQLGHLGKRRPDGSASLAGVRLRIRSAPSAQTACAAHALQCARKLGESLVRRGDPLLPRSYGGRELLANDLVHDLAVGPALELRHHLPHQLA